MTKEQAEEVRKKRLERFGPVDSSTGEAATAKDEDKIEDKAKTDLAKTSQKSIGKTDKSQIRCKHWPKCNFAANQCEYHHPTQECKYFPKSSYGDKCLYIHPEIPCKFGDACTRMNCAYSHKHIRNRSSLLMMKPLLMMAAGLTA